VLCAPERTRTSNLLIRSQMLYPLSYGRITRALCLRVLFVPAACATTRA
jgi:hypothetical protein